MKVGNVNYIVCDAHTSISNSLMESLTSSTILARSGHEAAAQLANGGDMYAKVFAISYSICILHLVTSMKLLLNIIGIMNVAYSSLMFI